MNNRKIMLITGANTGIGKATATALARTGARVVMFCRDQQRGEQAMKDIISDSGSSAVDLIRCDLGSLADIRRAAAEFKKRYKRLDVLINNAGVITLDRQETVDGFELQFGVNHLGHFLLTHLLLDMLKKSAPSRIVVVASGAHRAGRIHFDDINLRKHYSVIRSYGQAKLANVLFSNELARRLAGTGVTVNSLHPGAVASNIGVDRKTGFGKTIMWLAKLVLLTPEQGARTSVFLAADPSAAQITGTYFSKCRPVKTSRRAADKDAAEKLWTLSAQMTGTANA
ncbi:MAG: SDR family oxidoreductase [Spirochaetes bacterium]|nr:SDR family oxidoreductase [Spirochaetota bacterium]